MVHLLLQRGADVNAFDGREMRATQRAAEEGHDAIVELLMKRRDFKADFKNRVGQTLLSWAAKEGYHQIVEFLTARNDVEVDSRDVNSADPHSAEGGHEEIL